MIYLNNDSSSQVRFIPRTIRDAVGALSLSVVSTMDKGNAIELPFVVVKIFSDYIKMNISLPEGMTEGEYEYALLADSTIVSQGLLVIGDFSSPTEYNNVIEYEQYE